MKKRSFGSLLVVVVMFFLITTIREARGADTDEIIRDEFYRRAITKSQLAEITGLPEDRLDFYFYELRCPIGGFMSTWDIRLRGMRRWIRGRLEGICLAVGPVIQITLGLDVSYEEMKRGAKGNIAVWGGWIGEVEEVGEKAYLTVMCAGVLGHFDGGHLFELAFLDADIDRVVHIFFRTSNPDIRILDPGVITELAKQIEENLKGVER